MSLLPRALRTGAATGRRTSLWAACGAVCLSVALLGACGGGSGDSGSTSTGGDPGTTSRGGLSVALLGGLPGDLDHVWVTVTGVALQSAAETPYGSDASWVTLSLSKPITVDLVALAAGGSLSLFSGAGVPVGTYRQVRLLLASPDGTLLDSARSAGLSHNLELARTLADGSTQRLPLESVEAAPSLAVQLPTASGVTIAANTAASLALEWSAEDTARPLGASGAPARWVLGGRPQAYDLDRTGAIIGRVDVSQVCGQSGAPATGCASGLTVHAQGASLDGSLQRWWRSVPVSSSGVFALYPLPPLAQVDVLLQGRNLRPQLVRQVQVDVGSLIGTTPTLVGDATHPLKPTLDTAAHAVQLASAAPVPATWLPLVQTLPGESLPRQRSSGTLDPLSGQYAAALPWADTVWDQSTWVSTLDGALSTVTPVEGAGGGATHLPATGAQAAATGASQGAASGRWALPTTSLSAGVTMKPLTVNLGKATRADRALLVVSDASGVVLAQDVSAQLASGGSVTLNLPASATVAGTWRSGYYSGVALRAWRAADVAANPAAEPTWVRAGQAVDLRTAASATVSLTPP